MRRTRREGRLRFFAVELCADFPLPDLDAPFPDAFAFAVVARVGAGEPVDWALSGRETASK